MNDNPKHYASYIGSKLGDYSPFPLEGSKYSPEWISLELFSNHGKTGRIRINADQARRIEDILYERPSYDKIEGGA